MTTPQSLKEIAAAIEAIHDEATVETPLHALLRAALCDREFTFGKLSTFTTGNNLSVDFYGVSNDGRNELYFKGITIYGTMTYGERKDAGAQVFLSSQGNAYIKAQDYGSRGFTALPEGARNKLAELVRVEYATAFPELDSNALMAEAAAINRLYEWRRHLSVAVREIELAARDGVS